MKILVTGASGLLGSEVLNALIKLGWTGSALDRIAFLQANAEHRASMFDGIEVVIHAAANTNVEQCELDPLACYHDNCFLTEQLYFLARRRRVKFVFISSTGIYGRTKNAPYHEYDAVSPTTLHHHSKYIAEQMVLASPDALVVRTGWLFGGGEKNIKNFVANRLNEMRATEGPIYANVGQKGSPTYARDCAQRLLHLIEDDCVGIYNVVNDGIATRFEYVRRIIELSGSPYKALPTDASGFKRHADVSENEAAVSYRMRFEGRPTLRPWQDALFEYMSDAGLLDSLSKSD